jgi:hypothetical protein
MTYLSQQELASGKSVYKHPVDDKQRILDSLFEYIECQSAISDELQELIHGDITDGDIQYMILQGVLDPETKPEEPSLEELVLTDEFIIDLFVLENPDFERFWKAYPYRVYVGEGNQRKRLTLKSVDKDDLAEVYLSKIITKDRHERLMKVLEWAKERNEINVRIDKFIIAEIWLSLEEEMNEADDESDNLQKQLI